MDRDKVRNGSYILVDEIKCLANRKLDVTIHVPVTAARNTSFAAWEKSIGKRLPTKSGITGHTFPYADETSTSWSPFRLRYSSTSSVILAALRTIKPHLRRTPFEK